MAKPLSDPVSLTRIKEALIYKAMAAGLLSLLRSFFHEMELRWGDVPTAEANREGDKRIIVLGRQFYMDAVKGESEMADIILHEILHHAFRHLETRAIFSEQGYNDKVQNLAMDAIINAYLARAHCADFMKRYYPDEGEFAFLRSGSTLFVMPAEDGSKLPLRNIDSAKEQVFVDFYKRLYSLDVSLEEALAFFQEHFPQPSDELPLLGSHGGDGSGQSKAQGTSSSPDEVKEDSQGDGDDQSKHQGESSSADQLQEDLQDVIDKQDALNVLRKIGVLAPNAKATNTFLKVIRQVTKNLAQPGVARVGMRQSRRLPAKLGRRDLLQTERERPLFTRSDYRRKEVTIFLDISGSVTQYIPFVVGLFRHLRESEFTVHCVCWAAKAVEYPVTELLAGNLPDAGSGTEGQAVAEYIERHQIDEAVIITDNDAGLISTPIAANVHLCLIPVQKREGSFLNKQAVPRCRVYDLHL